MEDIYHWCREGNTVQVRLWLDDTEHDMNQGDDHGFSLLHWAAKEGHYNICETLVARGARVSSTNLGDDTPLHLATAHGHRDVVHLLLRHKADVNFVNEHGNTPLHYACFWGSQILAEDLIHAGSSVSISNKYGHSPLDKCRGSMAKTLQSLAISQGQNMETVVFKESWLGLKTRSRDATLSRHKGINIEDLALHKKMFESPSGELWKGKWQGNLIVAKILHLRQCTPRIVRDFNDEFPKLRIFSHPNVLPVVGCSSSPPNLVVITQYLPYGSLFNVLHREVSLIVDTNQALKFALDIAQGMAFIHSLENRTVNNLYLSSKHVMIDDDLTARISMADAKFSFQEKGKLYSPQWFSPEALQKRGKDLNSKAADMWSFAVTLWEMATREVPFAELAPQEAGMRIALEGLRLSIPPGISPHISKLIKICMNEDAGKRPSFAMIIPILSKMVVAQ